MAIGTTAAIIGGGLLGGLAGAIPKGQSSSSSTLTGPASDFENSLAGTPSGNRAEIEKQIADLNKGRDAVIAFHGQGAAADVNAKIDKQIANLRAQIQTDKPGQLEQNYNIFQNYINAGPGQSDVTAGYEAQKGLASMYGDYAQSGGLPSQGDINTSNQFASQLFAPQQTALNQSFTDQNIEANRRAALMGRSLNDPILAAKLATEQTRQSQFLNSQMGSAASQMALALPGQRLGFEQQKAGILSGLATQAMSNRQQLMAMGEGLMNNERNWRISTAQRNNTSESGGGFGGFLTGALGGAGAGMSLASGFNSPSASVPQPMSGMGNGLSGMNYNQSPSSFFGVSPFSGVR